ncbi:PseG/SpsG family protein [Streptomyces sp. AC495_CC817]|uniref:PseG/SpsG family protein n=1 Tax=Streptomyces sp. AC495_CC817 TaxID=2823900 RepID=UPI001C280140|nr:hypothetical protein [Streptomyces sp. AC495_CC817]
MRCLIRADATVDTGTGHVMRCLTLAEELVARGHEVHLRGHVGDIPWLHERLSAVGVRHEEAVAHVLEPREADAADYDVAVVDSYEYSPEAVSAMARLVPTLAIIDGDDRGIVSSLYLDQNLGADDRPGSPLLAGPRFALVRGEIVRRMRVRPRALSRPPRILAFMGGSDPTGAILTVAESLARLDAAIALDIVVTARWRQEVARLVGSRPSARLLEPTPRLPELLSEADITVSATGTSAWEICTVGIPAVFVAVVDNQLAGFRAITERGIALGSDLTSAARPVDDIHDGVLRLLHEPALRTRLFDASRELFDGRGASRVADALERLASSV